MIKPIQQFVLEQKLIGAGDRVLAGVSGGADSVAMLIILNELREKLSFNLFACHLNHQLRGDDADADENFVRELCEKISVPIYTEKQDIKTIRETTGGTLEEVARRVRYEFFERAAKKFNANKIALAHHRDDQCETIVFNLLRGSSFHGLRGIPISRSLKFGGDVQIIRPMLGVSKSKIENFLLAQKLVWREDHTNAELLADRNLIRHKILPMLEQSSPALREHLLSLAEQAGEIETILTDRAKSFLPACKKTENDIRIELWRFEGLPKIVINEILRQMLMELGVGLKKYTAENFRQAASLTKNRLDLPGGICARIERGWFIIGQSKAPVENNAAVILCVGPTAKFERFEFTAELGDYDAEAFKTFLKNKTRFEEWIDADKIQGPLVIRHARAGERFHPLGSSGSKKISDFLTDVKAGFAEKPATIIADDLGIIWLVGFRVSQRVRIDEETKNILVLARR
jgi:tRNA(Ile)-lysidine synthase